MPLYHFRCPKCGPVQRILDIESGESGTVPCKKCGEVLRRTPRGASTNAMEYIDSGVQARATERPADAQRIFAEREIEHDLEFGDGRAEHDEELTAPIDDGGEPV